MLAGVLSNVSRRVIKCYQMLSNVSGMRDFSVAENSRKQCGPPASGLNLHVKFQVNRFRGTTDITYLGNLQSRSNVYIPNVFCTVW